MPQKRKDFKIEGADLWYLVGLITSDGCLSSDGRHIDITSKDNMFLSKIKNHYGFVNKVCNKYNGIGQLSFHLTLGNRSFYEFLLSVGLSPNKSLTIKSVDAPAEYFCDFLRGVIDGDGCIRRWIHPSNKKEQWSLRVYSGSQEFIAWLNKTAEQLLRIRGKMHNNANNAWVLKYGKMAAREIAKKCYYRDCFGLDRKIKLAKKCFDSYRGWSKSKTVFN